MLGSVIGGNSVLGQQRPMNTVLQQAPVNQSLINAQQNDMVFSTNYLADNSGCGHYRLMWPQYLLNATPKFSIQQLNKMVFFPQFYAGQKVVRIQRQVSNEQYQMVLGLRQMCDKYNVRLAYEIDDIPFIEDIPEYNAYRKAYDNSQFRSNIENIMNLCDEITVTNPFMRDYFRSKISNQNITVIPNRIPRFWMDRFYDENRLKINFQKNSKKPRILYAGSSAHYDLRGQKKDDFTAIESLVRKTVNEFQWVFFGGVPRKLVDLLKAGKIELHNWVDIPNYPSMKHSLKINLAIAPLVDNNFNRAKSNIKYIENAVMGVPCICQDMVTYDDALYKFKSANDLYDQIKKITKNTNDYMKACRKSYQSVTKKDDNVWLDDNIGMWEEFYKFGYQADERKVLNALQ